MGNNVRFNVFRIMIVQVHFHVIRSVEKKFVHRVGPDATVRFTMVHHRQVEYE